jgi:hypothetical protein
MLTAATGWYLYGITRSGAHTALLADIDDPQDEATPLQFLECDALAAVVRPLRLADLPAENRERPRSSAELESLVWSHNRVVDAVHAQQAMLPAKFGMVYTHDADIVAALRSAHDALLSRLDQVDGCDEWAVHLYTSRALVRETIVASDPAIRLLREACAASTRGRAYFRERQLRDDVDATTRLALETRAQQAFARLMEHAVAGQVNAITPVDDSSDDVEILRATFLIARHQTERFQSSLRIVSDGGALRSESSGPWPPYSFAALQEDVS